MGSINEFCFAAGCLPVPALVQRYGSSRVYLIGILLLAVGLLGDAFADSLEVWFLTHGVLVGTGMAVVFMTAFDLVYKHTPKSYRGLCVGTSFAGGGCGAAVLSLLLTLSVSVRGLSATMLVLMIASCCYTMAILSLVMALVRWGHHFVDLPAGRSSSSKPSVPDSVCSCCPTSVRWFTDRNFLLFLTAMVLYLFGFSVPYNHLPQHAEDQGVPEAQAAGLLSVMGICNAVGRISFAYLGDRAGGAYLGIFTVTVFVAGLLMFLLPHCGSYWSLSVFAASYGLFAGGRVGLTSLVCCELFGQNNVSNTYSLLGLAFMFSQTLGSPVVGRVHDASGSYMFGFLLTSVLMAAAFLVLLLLVVLVRVGERDDLHCSNTV